MKRVKIGGAKNARSFFFFLLITTVMAALIKLSKTYVSTYAMTVKITEVPIEKTITSISLEEIEVKVENSGFAMLRNNWSIPEVHIPFKSLQKDEKERTYRFSFSKKLSEIEHTLSNSLNIMTVTEDDIMVIVDEMATKEVIVQPDIQLEYVSGYRAKGNISIAPKTIKVVGPHSIIDKLEFVNTELFKQEEVKDNIEVSLSIAAIDSLQGVTFEPTTIVLSQKVVKYTEGTVTVPVTVLNRGSREVKILPKDIEVVYSVDLDDFENIKGKDFVVTCDLSNVSGENNYLPLTIKDHPEEVSLVRLVHKQVQFIVID